MKRPRPVLTTAGVAGAVTSVAGILTWLGYSDAATHLSAESKTLVSLVIGAVTLASHLLAGLHAQAKVTPLEAPRTATGHKLVPAKGTRRRAGQHRPAAANTTALHYTMHTLPLPRTAEQALAAAEAAVPMQGGARAG